MVGHCIVLNSTFFLKCLFWCKDAEVGIISNGSYKGHPQGQKHFLDREERKGIASVGKTDESEQFEGMFF